MNNGPYSLTSLMLASAVTIIAQKLANGNIHAILVLLFLVVFLSALFQMVFGLFKIGELVKYIPYPVTSGLLNGTAILIFWSQVRPMLGVSAESMLGEFRNIQPLTLIVGLITILFITVGPRITKKIPAPFLGIAAGTMVYYAFVLLGFKNSLGSIVGTIPFMIPAPHFAAEFWSVIFTDNFLGILKELVPLSFSIAVVASLQSLIASVSVDNLRKARSDTNRELIGQGFGNLVSSVFGGIVSAGSQSRAIASHSYGGRTANSRLFSGIFALAVLLVISPMISKLPKVVLAGMLVVLALRSFDAWGFNLVSLLLSKKAKIKQVLSDLIVVITVTAILVVFGAFEAVAVGLFISVIFFIFRMGKDIIRREYNASRIRSNVHRSLEEIEYLEANGNKIKVFELEGSLFFGTADRIADAIDKALETEIEYIVVDLRKVSDVDSTGANILIRIRENCKDKNRHFILSSISMVRNGDPLSAALSISHNNGSGDDGSYDFETIDEALGWAEDRLLEKHFGQDRYNERMSLSQLDVLDAFSENELVVLNGYLSEAAYNEEDVVFRQNMPSDRMYFLVQGMVDIVVDLPQGQGREKIARLCPGTVFGEMAIIDRGLRSANVMVETHAVCWHLTNSELGRLNKEQPELAHKLLIGISRELSKRVRISNRIATELKA